MTLRQTTPDLAKDVAGFCAAAVNLFWCDRVAREAWSFALGKEYWSDYLQVALSAAAKYDRFFELVDTVEIMLICRMLMSVISISLVLRSNSFCRTLVLGCRGSLGIQSVRIWHPSLTTKLSKSGKLWTGSWKWPFRSRSLRCVLFSFTAVSFSRWSAQ